MNAQTPIMVTLADGSIIEVNVTPAQLAEALAWLALKSKRMAGVKDLAATEATVRFDTYLACNREAVRLAAAITTADKVTTAAAAA